MSQRQDPNIFEFNNVFRDGVQSNLGTNLPAEEIIDMLLHTSKAEYASVQAAGGTFMDLFIRKGRDAWDENDKIFDAFKDVVTTALIRGDCVLGYERNPQDVIDAVIEELADRGLKVVTNFHGMNYAPMQKGVFKAVAKARKNDYDITAPKVLCIEDNPNITIENCMQALAEQKAMGADEGIYLKNASGKCDPDFVYELTKRIAKEYPGEKITVHSHDNHGLAKAVYLRAGEAAAETNTPMAFDVLPHPMAQGTAQPSARDVKFMFDSHTSEIVKARSPQYNEAAEAPDFRQQYETRHRYADAEVRYNKRVWDACYLAGMAGGAMAAIKGMGIPKSVKTAMKLDDEDAAFAAVAGIEADVKAQLGYPTSVTPYQKMMDEMSGFEAVWRTMTNGQVAEYCAAMKLDTAIVEEGDPKVQYTPFSRITGSVVNYLTGGLGDVPPLANPKLLDAAFKAKNLEKHPEFIQADKLPPKMAETQERLQEAGVESPSQADVALAAMFGKGGFDHVIKKAQGLLEPQGQPEWPRYLPENPEKNQRPASDNAVFCIRSVAMALGGPAELERLSQAVTELQKHKDGFYKTQMGPCGFYQRSSQGKNVTGEFSGAGAGVKSDPQFLAQIHEGLRQQAQQEVQEFINAMPSRFREYGFTPNQAMAACYQHVPKLLEQVVERKTKGLLQGLIPSVENSVITKAYEGYEYANGHGRPGKFNGASSGQGKHTQTPPSRFAKRESAWPIPTDPSQALTV
ncbi:MAG: hypothetical protein R3E13_08480 [Alphaproteobacteria bacterium]